MSEKQQRQVGLSNREAGNNLTIINADFVADLRTCGYSLAAIKAYGEVVGTCGDWLIAQGVKVRNFGEDSIARFVGAYAAKCRRRRWPSYRVLVCRRALRRWLLFLRRGGLTGPLACPCATSQDRLLQVYDRYLAEVRGLALGTRLNRR